MKNNTGNIKQNILFCTPTLPECKGLFADKKVSAPYPKSIIAEMISEGELIHFVNKNFMEVRLFPLQLCLAVSGALRNFLGHPVVTSGNTLFINDGLREESTVEMMELLCKNKQLSPPSYQTAIYRTGMDEAQNIEDILRLMSLLNPALIVLDCTLIDYTQKPQELLVYALINLLITLNRLHKITLLCFTNGPINFEKVPAFQTFLYTKGKKRTPFDRTFLLELSNEERRQYVLRTPASPDVFEAFRELTLQKDQSHLWFTKAENRRFLFF